MGTEFAVDPYLTDVFANWIIDLGNFPTEQKHFLSFSKGATGNWPATIKF